MDSKRNSSPAKAAQVEQQNRSLADLGAQIDEWLRAQNDFVNADQFAGILRTLLKLAQDDADADTLAFHTGVIMTRRIAHAC